MLPHRFAHLALVALLAGCASARPERAARLWLVLVDASGSIDPKAEEIYANAWNRLLAEVSPGDQVTVLRIATGVSTQAQPVVDVTLPDAPGLLDNSVMRNREISSLIARMRNVSLVERSDRTATTPILETLATASRRLAMATRDRHVIVMSDMIEESEGLDFRHRAPDGDAMEAQLDRWLDDEGMRAWQGTQVHVVYAGGVIATSTSRAIERFWRGYLAALGATVRSWNATLDNLPSSAPEESYP